MPSLLDRLLNIATAGDEVVNAVVGGKPRETISGSVARAFKARKWWAPLVMAVIDAVYGKGHCLAQAAIEAVRRDTKEAG